MNHFAMYAAYAIGMKLRKNFPLALLIFLLTGLCSNALADLPSRTCPSRSFPLLTGPTRVFDTITPTSRSTQQLVNPLVINPSHPLKILALGDSVVWGDGLKNESKFVYLVGKMVAEKTGRSVNIVTYAHSAAKLDSGVPDFLPNPQNGITQPQGDLDSGSPTIFQEEDCAHLSNSDAEIILMDGCINNVGGSHIALPLDRQANPEQITATALHECQKMNELVRKTKDDFKEATIILVNYFQVVSTRSSMTDLIGLTPIAGPMDILARACNNVTSHIGLGTPCTHKRWERNSTAFLSAVTSCFDWTAAVQNGLRNPNTGQPCEIAGTANPRLASKVGANSRVYVATVENKPEFAYGAPQRHLWLMPGLFLHHDDMYEMRKGICYATFDKDPNKKKVCRAELRNPIAHPNVLGAIAYADKIIELLDAAWVKSPTVSSPTP